MRDRVSKTHRVLFVLLALTAIVSPLPMEASAQSGRNPVCDPDLPNLWKRDTQFLEIWWKEARPVDVAECLEAGADPNAPDILRHAAEWTRFPAVVEMLISAGADPDPVVGPDRVYGLEPPLFWAAQRTDNVTVVYGVIAALLFANADMGPDRFGYTTLYHVISNQPNSVALVELILEAGADPNGSWGSTSPLREAAMKTTNPRVLETLLAAGADPNTLRGTNSPLWLVVGRCKPNLARVLLEYGADPKNGEDDLGFMIHHAENSYCGRSDEEAIVQLLRGG